MTDQRFIDYMTTFQAATEHTNTCPACQDNLPCPTGDPIHAAFLTQQAVWEAEQRRQKRNADRRAKRRADHRARIARHAARELVTWGAWEGDRPTATAQDVVRKAAAMYGAYLKDGPITQVEAAAALAAALGN
ncbi:hypothetical protein GCM10018781_81000 [Kitasatospora indigofera]|uniref:Uncharacterized protein n=1 Tax=Kitasatospora indigofera TaxID=67307 RepID=A0A918YZJ2_9ACTN|nr:hypothetical protein [Kitasatospora indigofera]GHE29752.1 hypothetical protein GCM10018781_81000 [Kitasatospora indigofera]